MEAGGAGDTWGVGINEELQPLKETPLLPPSDWLPITGLRAPGWVQGLALYPGVHFHTATAPAQVSHSHWMEGSARRHETGTRWLSVVTTTNYSF